MWHQAKLRKERAETENDHEPRVVEVFFMFYKIGEIDTMNERFLAEVRIETKWIEPHLIETYDPKKHWNPKLYIENAMQLTKEDVRYKVAKDAFDGRNTVVTEIRKVRGYFWERLELENFPLDSQELSIILASTHEHSEIKLVEDKQRLSHIDLDVKHTFTDQQKWYIIVLTYIWFIFSNLGSY